jgi:hypothetical protein
VVLVPNEKGLGINTLTILEESHSIQEVFAGNFEISISPRRISAHPMQGDVERTARN